MTDKSLFNNVVSNVAETTTTLIEKLTTTLIHQNHCNRGDLRRPHGYWRQILFWDRHQNTVTNVTISQVSL